MVLVLPELELKRAQSCKRRVINDVSGIYLHLVRLDTEGVALQRETKAFKR